MSTYEGAWDRAAYAHPAPPVPQFSPPPDALVERGPTPAGYADVPAAPYDGRIDANGSPVLDNVLPGEEVDVLIEGRQTDRVADTRERFDQRRVGRVNPTDDVRQELQFFDDTYSHNTDHVGSAQYMRTLRTEENYPSRDEHRRLPWLRERRIYHPERQPGIPILRGKDINVTGNFPPVNQADRGRPWSTQQLFLRQEPRLGPKIENDVMANSPGTYLGAGSTGSSPDVDDVGEVFIL